MRYIACAAFGLCFALMWITMDIARRVAALEARPPQIIVHQFDEVVQVPRDEECFTVELHAVANVPIIADEIERSWCEEHQVYHPDSLECQEWFDIPVQAISCVDRRLQ